MRVNIFKDGHDVLAARVLLRKDGEVVDACALVHTGNDEWSGTVRPAEMGLHELVVQAWTDRYATWAHRAAVKLAARQDVHNEIGRGGSPPVRVVGPRRGSRAPTGRSPRPWLHCATKASTTPLV